MSARDSAGKAPRSIERRLLRWVLGTLALGVVAIGIATYFVTRTEMDEFFDETLDHVAHAVAHSLPIVEATADANALRRRPPGVAPHDTDIAILAWTKDGQLIFRSDPDAQWPFSHTPGHSRITDADGTAWHVFSAISPAGIAQAAQRRSARRIMAGESAISMLIPLLALVALVGALMVYALRRSFAPLDAAATDIATRSATSLAPIPDTDVPRELLPLLAAVNALLQRLEHAFSVQHSFVADAAHELRTPATALRLQLRQLARAGDDAARAQAMRELQAGFDRMQRLIEQLLQLSRSDPHGRPLALVPMSLDELVRGTVVFFSAEAAHRGIDLGARADQPVLVEGDPHQLRALLDNLVHNALRYVPSGGVVDVSAELHDGRPVLRVTDDGPGIPETERSRIFDRFYRGEAARGADEGGSGLGLAIVNAIAQAHGAQVTLASHATGRGLDVRVTFKPMNAQPSRPI